MVLSTINRKLVSMSSAAAILRISNATLTDLCDQGVIPAFRVGPRGERLLLETDVVNLRNRLARAARQSPS